MIAASKGKNLIRGLNRKGSRSGRTPLVARATAGPQTSRRRTEPAACESCGAVFVRKTWRDDHEVTGALLARARWITCPACAQVERGEYFGRVLARGVPAGGRDVEVRRRIRNVEARARSTQPERRVVSIERQRGGLEVLTTSQKLAHRIARELEKAFGGRTSYKWSAEGCLLAVWEAERSDA